MASGTVRIGTTLKSALTLGSIATLCATVAGCAGTASVPASNPPPPGVPSISVSVTPGSASVLLGNELSLSATVSNSSNAAVTWSVSGIPGGGVTQGVISSEGIYTAPAILPSPANITITAISVADSSKAATANVTLLSDISLTLSPATPGVELGAQQPFQAGVVSAGRPSTNVLWSLSGPGCAGLGCGTVDAGGVVTAPRVLPSPSSEIVTATSVADASRRVTGIFNVTSNFSLLLTGPATVLTGGRADYVSTMIPVTNSNPSTDIAWSLSGSGCVGIACGALSISNAGTTVTYTAPSTNAPPGPIHITATPMADPSKAVTLDVTVQKPVTLSPSSSTRAVDHRQRFVAAVLNSADTTVNWFVNGVPGGNSAVGRVCVADSNPCVPALSALAGEVDYIAPSSLPAPNPVSVAIVSVADATKSASSPVTILPHLVVSVAPPSAAIAPGASRLFIADVAGTDDQQVVWQVSGAACGAAEDPCGVINPAGVYSAPPVPPSPNTLAVTATSTEDTSRSGSAAVTILTDPAIISLLPSSITAGGAGGTTLRVEGGNFAAGSPGPGSIIRIDGVARATLCDSAAVCSTTLSAGDVALAGNRSVRVQNPGGALSAAASLVIVSPATGADSITLTPGAPSAVGKDIVVVDLSSSGSSVPIENAGLNIVSLSPFQASTGSCTIGGGPVVLFRPASGMAAAHLCAFSVSGLDPASTYTFSGPVSDDIAIVGKEPVGLGIVHLTLALPSTAQTGARTMFVENSNRDVTAASGAAEIR
jgi:hypothetical protein